MGIHLSIFCDELLPALKVSCTDNPTRLSKFPASKVQRRRTPSYPSFWCHSFSQLNGPPIEEQVVLFGEHINVGMQNIGKGMMAKMTPGVMLRTVTRV